MPTTTYLWDETNDVLIGEHDGDGSEIAYYTNEPEQFGPLVSQDRADSGRKYYHSDALGSTVALTDQIGNVTDIYAYNAFGETVDKIGSTVNPFGFCGTIGYYANPETVDHYVRARMYQRVSGRWSSVDPLDWALMLSPLSFNRYTFALNNPGNLVDPSGLAPKTIEECPIGCGPSLAAVLADPPKNLDVARAMKCNIHIFCAPSCGDNLSGNTFPSGGFIHVCVSEAFGWSYPTVAAILFHELTHAFQFLKALKSQKPPIDACQERPWPGGDPEPPPIGMGNCRTCIAREIEAYRASCEFMFPENRDLQKYCIARGVCGSCASRTCSPTEEPLDDYCGVPLRPGIGDLA